MSNTDEVSVRYQPHFVAQSTSSKLTLWNC